MASDSDFFVISSSRNIKGYETDHIFSEKQSQIGIDNVVGGGGMWSHLTTGGTTNILSAVILLRFDRNSETDSEKWKNLRIVYR